MTLASQDITFSLIPPRLRRPHRSFACVSRSSWPSKLRTSTPSSLASKMIRAAEEGTMLFQEVKKDLVLGQLDPSHEIPMFSRRVDEVWHQFVLFTHQYYEFSMRFFGDFVHHVPRESPNPPSGEPRPRRTIEEFRAIYEPLFGPLWTSGTTKKSLRPNTSRVSRQPYGKPMQVRTTGDKAELVLLRNSPVVMCRVDARAAAALEFVLGCDIFYVRELPGLSDEDRVALATTLAHLKSGGGA